MIYTVHITRRAQKELAALTVEAYRRVRHAIETLAMSPRPPGCAKLSGRDGWRIRIGDYRVIYTIDDEAKLVTVVNIGHRREIYR